MLARAKVRCYILTLVQYYANTTDSYIHSVKTEPYVKEILNNLQYYPPETHPLSPAKLVLTILTKPRPLSWFGFYVRYSLVTFYMTPEI